jgi:hypothetical protein
MLTIPDILARIHGIVSHTGTGNVKIEFSKTYQFSNPARLIWVHHPVPMISRLPFTIYMLALAQQ